MTIPMYTEPYQQLPRPNFEAPINADDLTFLTDVYTEEILDRMQVFCGGYRSVGMAYGVVDEKDPADTVQNETNRPLMVSINIANSNMIDVKAGIAVTKQGQLILIDKDVTQFNLENSLGSVLVDKTAYAVFVEYFLVPSVDERVANFGTELVPVKYERPTDLTTVIKVARITDLSNTVLFPKARLESIVVLAVISVNDIESTRTLDVDLSRLSYPYNRPWFSPVDIEHRMQLGSGSVTSANPHGTSLNDLTDNGLTLYQQMTDSGQLIAKGQSFPVIPGTKCQQLVTSMQIHNDTNGRITGRSYYGGTGSPFFLLDQRPIRVGAAYASDNVYPITNSGQPTVDYPVQLAERYSVAVDWIPGTNIVVLGKQQTNLTYPAAGAAHDGWNDQFYIEYFNVPAFSFPVQAGSDSVITFTEPSDGEIAITEGRAVTGLNYTSVSFEDLSKFPRRFKSFVTKDKEIILTPQILVTPTIISAISLAASNSPESLVYTPANITIGLADAGTNSVSVDIQLNGVDVNGQDVSELVSFRNSNWTNYYSLPATNENYLQFQTSKIVFQSLTNWALIRNASTPNASISVFADLVPSASYLPTNSAGAVQNYPTRLNGMMPIAEFFWDGLSTGLVIDINTPLEKWPKDIRPLRTSLHAATAAQREPFEAAATALLFPFLGTTPGYIVLAHEDFRNPRYLDTKTVNPYDVTGLLDSRLPNTLDDPRDMRNVYRTRALLIDPPTGSVFNCTTGTFIVVLYGAGENPYENHQVYLRYFQPMPASYWTWTTSRLMSGWSSYPYNVALYKSSTTLDSNKIILEIFGKCTGFTLLRSKI